MPSRRFVSPALVALALFLCSLPPTAARVAGDVQGEAHMEIDADPTNGSRPCSPIDAVRSLAATSGTYTVAICVDESGPSAVAGFEARVIWSGGVASAVELPDVLPAFDDNPDFNQAPGPVGNGTDGWECSGFVFNYPVGDDPTTPAADAHIVCTRFTGVGEMTASPGLLATITMQAAGAGTETFTFPTEGENTVMYESFQEHVCGHPVSCIGASVVQGIADADNDGVADATDNCPSVPNPGQQNADTEIDNGPNIAPRDVTVPNAIADSEGDACETDGDTDNDGLPDASEAPLAGCGMFDGAAPDHPNPAGGDVTNDDNANGTPAPADAADNGPSWDTDNDGALDAAECLVLTNPRTAVSKPTAAACGGNADGDLDGLSAASEKCKWGTSDANVESDGDGKKDCVEANDTNGDGVQNFPGDTINSAKAANSLIGKTMDFDLNGDGAVNFPGDTILSAKMANHVGSICL